MLNQTPLERMVDPQGRPYFLWDTDLPLAVFRERLQNPDVEVRAYLVGKLMRRAKPDDVFTFYWAGGRRVASAGKLTALQR